MSTLKTNFETLVAENGLEIAVGYRYKKSAVTLSPQVGEEDDGITYTELEYVEVIIKGHGVDILDRLSERQKEAIIDLLTYE